MKKHYWRGASPPRSSLPMCFKTKVLKPGDEGWTEAPLKSGEVPRPPRDENFDRLELEDIQ